MFKIKKNVLNKNLFEKINTKIQSKYFPWFTQDYVNAPDESGYGYFTHYLYLNNKINSPFYDLIMPEFLKLFKNKKLLRARLNLYTKTPKTIKHAYHIDYMFKHRSVVYFLNDNDGCLFFKDPYKKIKPEKNKCVIFDGNYEHASSSCTDRPYRITLNINYEF